MAKMSNRKKEEIAVGAVVRATYPSDQHLQANIPVGDKAPSFDGQITVFKDGSERKESYINDVPTQVKGTGVEKFTKGNRKFPLDLQHYENYYKRGGCLLLVVEILENTDTKIFYKQLLPIELKAILDTWKTQKKYSVELRPLEETNLYMVCINFIEHMIKQPRILIERNQYKEEDYEKLIFTSLTFNPKKNGFDDIFNHDFFEFGLKDNIEYPLRNTRVDTIAISQNEEFEINGKSFRVMVETKYKPPLRIRVIEDSLKISIKDNSDEFHVDFNSNLFLMKSLSTQLKVLSLLLELIKSEKNNLKEVKKNKRILENYYVLLQKLQKIFAELKIDENVPFGNIDYTFDKIERFIEIMVNKNYGVVKVSDPDKANFCKYSIGKLSIMLFYFPHSDTRFVNAFSKEVSEITLTITNNETGEHAATSPYILLEKDALVHTQNIDYDILENSLMSSNFESIDLLFSPLNNFCLVCLNAFDETKNKRFLQISLNIWNKLKGTSIKGDNQKIVAINILQVKFRQQGGLTSDDYSEVMDLKDESNSKSDSSELKFCLSVLLQSKNEAELLFGKLSPERRSYYKTLPIYTLYQNLK